MGLSSALGTGFDVGSAIAYLELNTTGFQAGIQSALGQLNGFGSQLSSKMGAIGSSLSNIGSSLTRTVTMPIAKAFQFGIDSAIDFESAFTGVTKTVDATEDEYNELQKVIRNMAKSTSSSAEDIAGVMEIVGQLGIGIDESGTKNLEKFTKTMVMLGDTTNLSAEEASTALAHFTNIMGTSTGDVDRLGSAVVDLGNNFATDEASIVAMATRLASAGRIAGLTEAEVLALSTAMTSVGINAEMGGSAMSKTLARLGKEVAYFEEGTENQLNDIAEISGMTAEQFASVWRSKPVEALGAFITGLNKAGNRSNIVLEELGIKEIRQTQMLQGLSLAYDMMGNAVDTANTAWEENTALSVEAEKRYGTTEAKLNQFKERLKEVGADLGERLIPVLYKLMDIIEKLLAKWDQLSPAQQDAVINFALVAGAIGPVLNALGNLISVVSSVINIFKSLKGAFSFLSGAGATISKVAGGIKTVFSGIGSFLSGAGATIAKVFGGIGLIIGGLITAVKNFVDMWKNGWDVIKTILEALGIALVAIGAIILGAPALVAGIIAGIVFLVSQLAIVIHDHWDSIKNWFIETWQAISDFASIACEAIKEFFVNAGNFITEKWQLVKDWFANVWVTVKENIIQPIMEALTIAGEKISEFWIFIQEKFALLVEWLKNLQNKIKEWFQQLWDHITNFLNDVWNNVKAFLENIFSSISDFISNTTSKIVEFFSNLISKTSEFISNAVSKISEFFSNVVSKISEFISNTISKIKEFFANLLQEIISKTTEIYNKIKEFITNLSSSIIDFISNILGKIKDFFAQLLSAVREKLNEIHSWVQDKFNAIVNFIKGLTPKIYQAGKDMINGLWNGIKEVFSGLWSWVQEHFGWIIDYIKKAWDAISDFGGMIGDTVGGWFDGSHATGLAYVPYNGYVAQLHEGERVLTKQENRDYTEGRNSGGDTYNIYSYEKLDEYGIRRELEKMKRQLDL